MAGRVKAEVTPKKGEKADFKIKSPTATASVRGTGFEFDGQNLLVDHGAVQLEAESGLGTPQMVASGEFSTVSQTKTITTPVAIATSASHNPLEAVRYASIATSNNSDSMNASNFEIKEKTQINEIKGQIQITIEWDD